MTATTTADAHLAGLAALRASRKDELDLPRTMTTREVHAYLAETSVLDQRLVAARTASANLAEVAPALDADTAWLAHLTAWREALCVDLLAIKSPIRDTAGRALAGDLTFSIRLIDFGLGISVLGPIVSLAPTRIGQLMRAAGYDTEGPALHGPQGWQGSMKEVERRIAELKTRQGTAQRTLDAMLRTDAEQATADTERAKMSAALDTMQVRYNSEGTGLVALTKDGDPLPETAMTAEQRAAFAWQQQGG